MRIGELLRLSMRDLDIRERRYTSTKGKRTASGEWFYLSDDALMLWGSV